MGLGIRSHHPVTYIDMRRARSSELLAGIAQNHIAGEKAAFKSEFSLGAGHESNTNVCLYFVITILSYSHTFDKLLSNQKSARPMDSQQAGN